MDESMLARAADPLLHLFWKAQIGILRACPPLHGVTIKHGMNAERSPKLWLKTLLHVGLRAPQALAFHLRDIRGGRVVLPRVSVGVTTRCTLRCDKCIARIPEIKHRAHVPFDELKRDLQALFSCADHIYDLNLAGGEAFLHPQLDEILRFCAASGKAGHIDITTNGTVLPGEKLIAALQDTKATVRITRYPPALQPKAGALKQMLKEHGIPYLHEVGAFWYDTDNSGRPQEGSARRKFSVCAQTLCFSFFGGKLHLCSASAAQMEIGIIPDCGEDYINLREASPAAFRAQWKKLREKRSISACRYCLGCSYRAPKVPVALQRGED